MGNEIKPGWVPTVGRIVHYTNLGDAEGRFPPELHAAIITSVPPARADRPDGAPHVSLAVFYGNERGGGQFFMPSVPYSAEPKPGHWSWPPRV